MQNFLVQMGVSANWAQDILALVFVVTVGAVLGFALGKSRMMGFLLGMYASLAILQALPVGVLPEYVYAKPIAFLVLSLFIAVLDAYTFNTYLASDALWKWIILGLLNTTLLASIVVSLLPQYVTLQFISYQAYGYLSNPWMFFAWVVLPIVFLLIANRTK